MGLLFYCIDSRSFLPPKHKVIRGKRFDALIAHFKRVKKELHDTGVIKALLWMEYLQDNPEGKQYGYLFGKYLKEYRSCLSLGLHSLGVYSVLFCREEARLLNKQTGEVVVCEVFVSLLHFSGLILCEDRDAGFDRPARSYASSA